MKDRARMCDETAGAGETARARRLQPARARVPRSQFRHTAPQGRSWRYWRYFRGATANSLCALLRGPHALWDALSAAGQPRQGAGCRLRGGAAGSGAPRGDRNGAYQHGRLTAEAVGERQELRRLLKNLKQ